MDNDERQNLDAFIDTIWIEKGLSLNTLNSYKSDIEKYFLWLSDNSYHSGKFQDQKYSCICRIYSKRNLAVNLLQENSHP